MAEEEEEGIERGDERKKFFVDILAVVPGKQNSTDSKAADIYPREILNIS